jgi:hypothetical protein
MWKLGREDSFLGIHKSDLLCSVAPEMGDKLKDLVGQCILRKRAEVRELLWNNA